MFVEMFVDQLFGQIKFRQSDHTTKHNPLIFISHVCCCFSDVLFFILFFEDKCYSFIFNSFLSLPPPPFLHASAIAKLIIWKERQQMLSARRSLDPAL